MAQAVAETGATAVERAVIDCALQSVGAGLAKRKALNDRR